MSDQWSAQGPTHRHLSRLIRKRFIPMPFVLFLFFLLSYTRERLVSRNQSWGGSLCYQEDRMSDPKRESAELSGTVNREARFQERLVRLPEVMARVGMRRSAIYQRMRDGSFPRSRSLGSKCTVWIESEIDDWIKSVEAT